MWLLHTPKHNSTVIAAMLMLAMIAIAGGQGELFAQEPQGLEEAPTLNAMYDVSMRGCPPPPNVPARYKKFLGLLIEENLVKELYPLLTYVFFDSGSAKIPDRYILFTDPLQTQNFNDSTIPGGTLQKYYHMLNIVGYRMRTHPETKITITGCNSEQAAIGEVIDVSKQRGQIVYDYIINIWKIDPSRVQLMPARGLPQFRSNIKDPLGIVENRRTEILSDDWEVMKPILQVDFRRYPQPDSSFFQMRNGINNDLVARRVIEIKRKGQMWHTMKDIGTTDLNSKGFFWGQNGVKEGDDNFILPTDEDPYEAQLVIYSKTGKECRSNIVTIPVQIITNEIKRRERLIDSTKDRYSVVLFRFNSPKASQLNERILKEYIYDNIRPGAKIHVTGYTDIVEDHSLKLSGDRANTVVNIIRKNMKAGWYTVLQGIGVGETQPLYRSDLPEGRFYDRTVQVQVNTPSGTGNR